MRKIIYIFTLLFCNISFAQDKYDAIFYQFPNSGVSFEGLYSNPTNGTACIGDFNEDGYPDMIVMGPNYDDFETSYVNLLQNNSDGTFKRIDLGISAMNNGSIAYTKVAPKQFILALQGGTASPAATNNAKGYIAELKYVGDAVSCRKKQDLDYGLIDGDLFFIDVDGNGHVDLVQLGGVRKAYVYLNDGANLYSLTADVTGLVGTYRGKSLVSDVNNDGHLDIVSISQSGALQVFIRVTTHLLLMLFLLLIILRFILDWGWVILMRMAISILWHLIMLLQRKSTLLCFSMVMERDNLHRRQKTLLWELMQQLWLWQILRAMGIWIFYIPEPIIKH